MAKKDKKTEEKEKIEREFVVPFAKLFDQPRKKRARKAIVCIQRFMFKHFRAKAENVSISPALNQAIWARGREHIPRRIEVKAVKEGEAVHVYLKGEKIEKPKEKKEEEKTKAGEKKEETKEEKEEIERKKEEKKAKEKAAEAAEIKRGTAKEGK